MEARYVTLRSMNTNTYLTTLMRRQDHEQWSNREMARQLRVSPATWQRIRHGERGLGSRVLRRTMARFPEYNHLAILFLLENAPDGNDDCSDEEPELLEAAS